MFLYSAIPWAIAATGFLVLECCTVALVSLWFALGALTAAAAAMLGAAFWLQTVLFLAVSCGLLAMLRPMLRKHMKITKTNVDSLIDAQGLVTEPISNLEAKGTVKLGAALWSARSSSGEDIPAGAIIRVDRIEGVKVFVTPVKMPVKN